MMYILENGGWYAMRAKEWFANKKVICDLDGPLIDSAKVVQLAYQLAGWKYPVPFGQAWHEWCPPEIYARKKTIYASLYPDNVKRGRAKFLGNMGCMVLTSAGTEAYLLAVKHFYPKLELLGCEKTLEQKIDILTTTPHDVYVDDDKSFIILLAKKGVKSCLIWCSSSPPVETECEQSVEDKNPSLS